MGRRQRVDFFLKNNDREYKCEVKLMGQGNPESADAIITRKQRCLYCRYNVGTKQEAM
ncbi:MAG: hypothetical protein IJ005_07940 [Bacteroidales bacterium]|nr:hypothetical protein [Bacteroidales bacterium]